MEKVNDIFFPKQETMKISSDDEIDLKFSVTTSNGLGRISPGGEKDNSSFHEKSSSEISSSDTSIEVKTESENKRRHSNDFTIPAGASDTNDCRDTDTVPLKRQKTKKELEEEEREKMQ